MSFHGPISYCERYHPVNLVMLSAVIVENIYLETKYRMTVETIVAQILLNYITYIIITMNRKSGTFLKRLPTNYEKAFEK